MLIENNNYMVIKCPVCNATRLYYLFSVQKYRLCQCQDCKLLFLSPQSSEMELDKINGAEYFIKDPAQTSEHSVAELELSTAKKHLELLKQYQAAEGGKLLEIGCGHGYLLMKANEFGYNVTGLECSSHACDIAKANLNGKGTVICGQIELLEHESEKYDVCVLSDVIEHIRDPRGFLLRINRLLKPDGVIFIATPNVESWSARFLAEKWMEFKPKHLYYFSPANLQSLMYQCGFSENILKPCVKVMNLEYLVQHFIHFPIPFITKILLTLRKLSPGFLHYKPFRIVPTGMIIMARKGESREKQKLSVIVPAFNEAKTIDLLLTQLIDKKIKGIDIEIVIVESNSTDGTRDIVLKYQNFPRIKVILEESPKGKGHAVRTGFIHAVGDFVLIQDADLEYDLEDYDALLEPLISGREAFVLGARHGGRKIKIRHFEGNPLTSLLFNAGHQIFVFLVNIVYRLSLRDPFTMFKVFRRDSLYGLEFECDRFDFDFELVIKLVRKGIKPVEIPVNYKSRSFAQGKKVSIRRDPWTWLWAIIKFRFVKIDPLDIITKTIRKN